jgi:3-hydroxyisobutyrate dehydrogenase
MGMMGLPMAGRLLQAGYRVVAWDIDTQALSHAQEKGAKTVDSCRQVAEVSSMVVTMLPSSREVEDVVLGKDGFLAGSHERSVLVDMSTSHPSSTKEIARRLSDRGVPMLDAPVAGGVLGARQGNLCIMVGGPEPTFQDCLPILQAMGEQIFYIGGTAAGHTVKIVSNYLSALSVAATAEAFALAVKAGLDPNAVSEVLKVSSGRNYSTEFKFPRYVLPRKFDDGFRLELYVKDLHLLRDISDELGVPMPIGQTLRKVYERAKDLGYGPESHTNIVRMIEQDAGVVIGS